MNLIRVSTATHPLMLTPICSRSADSRYHCSHTTSARNQAGNGPGFTIQRGGDNYEHC